MVVEVALDYRGSSNSEIEIPNSEIKLLSPASAACAALPSTTQYNIRGIRRFDRILLKELVSGECGVSRTAFNKRGTLVGVLVSLIIFCSRYRFQHVCGMTRKIL